MEARLIRAAFAVAAAMSLGASHRTENFIVTAPSADFARQVAESAERYRRDLAIEWLGHELPGWHDKCPITVKVGPQLGAGGATSFVFSNGRPYGWTMTIQGSHERVLDSVLPHEITHTIFATHFGRALPRWADEGACTTVEHVSERQKSHDMLYEFLTTSRGIAFNDMFRMQEYPPDILPLYAQGYSLARYLIAQGGKQKFVAYVGDGMKWNNWTKATQKHYGYQSLSDLQVTWLDWVRHGSPSIASHAPAVVQANAEASSESVASHTSPPTNGAVIQTVSGTQQPTPRAGGWYARVRDETIAARQQSGARNAAGVNKAPEENDSTTTIASSSVSRPLPAERPRQIILEWAQPNSHGSAPMAAQPPPLAHPKTAPPTSRLIPNFGQSLWR